MDFKDFIDKQLENNPDERKIVRKIVRTLRDAGTPIVRVWDGGESVNVSTLREVYEQVFNLDDAILYTADDSWVRLVFGNDPDELICDYTVNLEDTLAPVFTYAEKFAR